MSDMDWGDNQWDVDSKAEKLNKALFGKRHQINSNSIQADVNVDGKIETDFGKDSDDDEKLSKKAKKKLKERKRRENKRKKNKNVKDEENGTESNVENEEPRGKNENTKKKAAKLQNSTSPKKQKGKSKDVKLETKTKGNKALTAMTESSVENDKEKENVKKRKRKKPTLNNGDNETAAVKQSKIDKENDNSESNKEGEVKKKRKRRKKKKPNSKKNKYKHLGLKSKSDKPTSVESDTEDESMNGTFQGSEKSLITSKQKLIVNGDELKSEKGKKRKRSLSPGNLSAKKTKLVEESEKESEVKKKKKESKSEPNGAAEKRDIGDGREPVEKSKKQKKAKKSKSVDEQGESRKGNKLKSKSEKVLKKTEVQNLQSNSSSNDELKKGKKPKDDLNKKKKLKKSENSSEPFTTPSPFFTSNQGSDLQQKMTDKLASARFRFINEQLYTIKGGEAFRMFLQDKTLMEAYNTGFQGQVKQWSVNPLDVIIKQLSTKSSHLIVADFGCGEARLSASIPQKVHSFDLYALNKRVTVCDMAKTPLASGSADIAVFCLSLMGTNLEDYLLEANRVLKDGGLLKIAEVVSRFTVPNHFINAVSSMGFKAVNTRKLSTMFYLMDFKKAKSVLKHNKPISLKPCLYKKR